MRPDLHYARNGDIALAYQVVGDGPRDVLLVSGYLSNLEYAWMYPSMARFLTRLAGFSRLILTDRRGSGLSDRVWDPPPIETSSRTSRRCSTRSDRRRRRSSVSGTDV